MEMEKVLEMANGGEFAAGASSSSIVKRIFIGGLDASVKAADIERTFSSLGRVHNIQFVRTDGRSFGFMDFEPKSDKHMSKLFAVYNGCVWKGGKLRLEKAKEHYYSRLKREWDEDATSRLCDLDVSESADHSVKLEKLNQEDSKLQIYFPKLRKVKAVPFKGSGKHKYSFQRVEVPSLPIHFCDCEEHCGSSEIVNETYIAALNSAAFVKERSIMASVMNKFLQKEDNKSAQSGIRSFSSEPIAVDVSSDDTQLEREDVAQEPGTDNFVTNIGVGASDDMLMHLVGRETQPTYQVQESGIDRAQAFSDERSQNKAHSQKRQKTAYTTASKAVSSKAATRKAARAEDAFDSVLTRNATKKDAQEKGKSVEDSPIEGQSNNATTSSAVSVTTNNWIQKSSWKGLIGESGDSTFSILNVLPGISPVASKLPKKGDPVTKSVTAPKRKSQSGGCSADVKVKQDARFEKTQPSSVIRVPENERTEGALNDHNDGDENIRKEQRRSIPKIKVGEVCTFMRSAQSVKEWSKAKAALSGYLKMKGTADNNASKVARAKPSRR